MGRHLNGEGPARPGHLYDEQNDRQSLPHITEGDSERIDDIDKYHACRDCRQYEFSRLQTLDLQQIQISQRHDQRLCHTEEHED